MSSPAALQHDEQGGTADASARQLTLLEAVREGLREEMARDRRVVVLGEDVGAQGGVFGVTKDLQAEFGPERVLDTPLAELGIAGVAIGAALSGVRPVAEIQFADYIHPAYDQLVNEAAKIHYRSNGEFSCPVVFRAPFGAGVHGGLYHSQSVEALFFHVPGLKIVIPSCPADAKGLLKAAIRDDDPVLFFEHKKMYRSGRGPVPEGADVVTPLGKSAVLAPGEDVTVVTYGPGVPLALEAAASGEFSLEVIDLRTVAPLDFATIETSIAKTNRALILHEDALTGGVGAEVAALIADRCFSLLDAPVKRVAAADTHIPFAHNLEAAVLPSLGGVMAAIRELLAY